MAEYPDHISSEGYDFQQERTRYHFAPVSAYGQSWVRGKITAGLTGHAVEGWRGDAHALADSYLMPSTIRSVSPEVNLEWPLVGHHLITPAGPIFDSYLGVAQRLIDERHPAFLAMLAELARHQMLLRREAATNDIVWSSPTSGIASGLDVARAFAQLANAAFGTHRKHKVFLCNSGTEAVEASIKLAALYARRRFITNYGLDGERDLMTALGIALNDDIDHPDDTEPLYRDYPWYYFSARRSFHGRTLGSLALSGVRPVNKRAFPMAGRVRRFTFNGDLEELLDLIDRRPWSELGAEGIREVVRSGRVPIDLVAGLVIEPILGEGGYVFPESGWLRDLGELCAELGILVIADEVQTFGRTGRVFAVEHFGLLPDIVALGKSSIVSAAIARGDIADCAMLGWHSNTLGGSRVIENCYCVTALDLYERSADELFLGRSYIENQVLKEDYIRVGFEWIASRHPQVHNVRGLGGFWAFSIENRDDLVRVGHARGLKLLTCGVTRESESIRALFLADVLSSEVESFFRVLDLSLTEAFGRQTMAQTL